MPKINVYLPDELAAAVKEADLPVSAICQAALQKAVGDVTSARAVEVAPDTESERGFGLFTRFTPRARGAVSRAEAEAKRRGDAEVRPEHLLLGILDESQNLALSVLVALDVEPDDVRSELLASMPDPGKPKKRHVPFGKSSKKVLELALREALAFGHNYIGCEHLLMAVLREERSVASKVLRRMGVEERTARRTVMATVTGAAQVASLRVPAVDDPAKAEPDAIEQVLARLDEIEARLDHLDDLDN
jgi:ATP-dependent Clp protease ATP-binding subunit ClpC